MVVVNVIVIKWRCQLLNGSIVFYEAFFTRIWKQILVSGKNMLKHGYVTAGQLTRPKMLCQGEGFVETLNQDCKLLLQGPFQLWMVAKKLAVNQGLLNHSKAFYLEKVENVPRRSMKIIIIIIIIPKDKVPSQCWDGKQKPQTTQKQKLN